MRARPGRSRLRRYQRRVVSRPARAQAARQSSTAVARDSLACRPVTAAPGRPPGAGELQEDVLQIGLLGGEIDDRQPDRCSAAEDRRGGCGSAG